MSKVGTLTIEMSANVARLQTDMDRARRTVHSAMQQITRSAEVAAVALRGVGVGFSTLPVVYGLRAASDEARFFEKSLANLSALTGATGTDLKFYGDKAKELGLKFGSSAKEIVEGMKLIGARKPDLLQNKEALAAITDAVLTLSQAATISAVDAANSLTAALNQFQQPASKAGDMINVLAAGAQLGTAEISEMTMALRNSGATAYNVGISFEEANAGLQALAKGGIVAGRAGTAFKSILIDLESSTNKKLRPSVVGLYEAINNLGNANLSVGKLTEMFGKYHINAALTLINHREVIKTLVPALTGTSKAYEQAETNMDTFDGSVKRLSASFSMLLKDLGDKINPTLRELADNLQKLFTGTLDPSSTFARAIDTVTNAVTLLSVVIASRLVAAFTLWAAAKVTAFVALLTFVPAVTGLSAALGMQAAAANVSTVATNGFALAATGLSRIFALLGGPVGLIGLAAFAIYKFDDSLGKERVDEYRRAINELSASFSDLSLEMQKNQIISVTLKLDKAKMEIPELEAKLAKEAAIPGGGGLFGIGMARGPSGGVVATDINIRKKREEINYLNESLDKMVSLHEQLKALQKVPDKRVPDRNEDDDDKENKKLKQFLETLQALKDKILAEGAALDSDFYKNIRILNEAVAKGLLSGKERLELAEAYIKQQPFFVKQMKAEAEIRQYNIGLIEKENEALNKADEEKRNNVISMFETVEAMEFENSTLFMTNEQRKMSIFLRDMENKGIKEGSDEYKMLADRMAGAIKSETFLTKWKDVTTKIGDSLVDAIVDGGENAADMLRDMFKNLVLRPVVSAIVGSLGLGGAGGAMAAGTGGVGEALGLQNTISTLSNLYSTATGSFAKIATSVSGMATDVGAWMAEMGTTTTEVAGTIMSDSSSLMATAGEGIMDASSSIGSAASSLAGLYAGYAIGNAISGNKALVNDNPGYTTATGAAAGAYVGTYVFPVIGTAIGAVIGGILGGVANLAFGTGEKVVRDTGLIGKFSSTGAQVQNFQKWDSEGGWFRSDSEGTNYSGIGSDLQELLDVALKATATTVKGYVELLGLNSDAIAGFSQDLAFNLNGMTDEEAQQRIALAISNFGNFMIESLFKEVDQLRKRGETAGEALLRLSSSLKSVNSVFTVLHLKLMDMSVAGADASSKLIDTFGGIDNFVKATDFYYQNFYTEAERTNNTIEQLTSAFKALGLELPGTKDTFKAMVTAARDANNADLFAALLALAPAFDSVQKAAEDTGSALQQRIALERQLLELNGDTAAIAALERAEISTSNLALYDRIIALKASQAADAAATEEIARRAEADRIAADRARAIADEKMALEDRLAEGAMDVAHARAREMLSVDESNRALLARVYALEDERSSMAASAIVLDIFTKAIAENINTTKAGTEEAYNGLEKAISKQKEAFALQEKTAQESISTIKTVFDLIKNEVEELYQSAGAGMSRSAAAQFIQQAISTAKTTGYLPDAEELGKAINAAKSGMEPQNYSTAFELRRDRILLGNQLAELQAQAGTQLSTAEQQLVATQDQSLKLDAQLEAARLQIDAIRGINTSILTVGAANAALSNAILAELAARNITVASMTPAAYVPPPPPAPGVSSYGLPRKAFDAFISAGQITVEDAWSRYSTPAFAAGGAYGGGLALVGEEGPELINFRNPGMVYTAAQTDGLLGGEEMLAELRALRGEVVDLRYESRAIAVATTKHAKLADRWDNEGLTVKNESDTPIYTSAV